MCNLRNYFFFFKTLYTPITHRDNSKHSVGLSVPQQDVNKGNDLQCFAQPHAVSKDAAKATAGIIALQRLNEVIIEKPDSPNLRDKDKKRLSNKTSWTMIFF